MAWLPDANAQLFKCTTEDGKTAFQDAPCENSSKQEQLKIHSDSSSGAPGSCKYDILGTWTLNHISLTLDQDMFADSSQSWTFDSDGTVTHVSIIKQEFEYECKGDIITLHSKLKNDVKIIRNDGNDMVWKSIDFGGFLYMSR